MKELVTYIESLLGTDGITFKSQLQKSGKELGAVHRKHAHEACLLQHDRVSLVLAAV